MKYPVLFLDMDHTLCDTQKADGIAEDQLVSWIVEGLALDASLAQSKVRYFMRLLYEGHSNCVRLDGESEGLYRAKLLKLALGDSLRISIEQAYDWVEALMACRFENFDFFEGCLDMLRRLRDRRRTVVITNGPLYSQRPKVERVCLAEHVDRVLLAADYPWQKPAPEIFVEAMAQEGVAASEVLHVGDSLASDIAGAVAAGLDCCWVNPSGRRGPHRPKPTYEVAVITELEGLLSDLG